MRHCVATHRTCKRCGSSDRELLDLHLHGRCFQRSAHIIDLVSATEEWVKSTIGLHHNLRYNGQFRRLDGERTTLLRVEQILGYVVGLVDFTIEGLTEWTLLNIDLLTPKTIECRHLRRVGAGNIYTAIKFENCTHRLALVYRFRR